MPYDLIDCVVSFLVITFIITVCVDVMNRGKDKFNVQEVCLHNVRYYKVSGAGTYYTLTPVFDTNSKIVTCK